MDANTYPRPTGATAAPRTATTARPRTAAVGGVAALLGGATLMFPTPDPDGPAFLAFTACNVVAFGLLIVAVAALGLVRATGPGRAGRFGLGVSVVALIGYAGAEIATGSGSSVAEVVHPVTVPLLGIGMTVVGVTVIRAGGWRGWVRPTPLICGLIPLAVELPWFLVLGPNQTIISLSWAGWLLLGAALVSTAIGRRSRAATAGRA